MKLKKLFKVLPADQHMIIKGRTINCDESIVFVGRMTNQFFEGAYDRYKNCKVINVKSARNHRGVVIWINFPY